MKLRAITAFLAVAMAIGFTYAWLRNQPPKDDKLVANFYAHRTAFERLRDMLEADQHLLRIASWGVETSEPIGVHIPPAGDFPASRYNVYLACSRKPVARWRFAAEENARRSLAWEFGRQAGEAIPGTSVWCGLITRLLTRSRTYEFYRSPKPGHPVFRHIDQNWYLWANW